VKGTIVGILSSRSRTPLPKLMQSCQSFYAICNRISLRRRTGAPLCLGKVLLFRPFRCRTTAGCQSIRRLRLKTSLFPSYFSRVYLCVPFSFHTLPNFLSASSFRSLPFSASRRKVSRDFLSPFFHPFPSIFHPRYRPISATSVFSVRDRFSRNSVIKPVVYG